ncbi:LysR family transcriptional regulator [Motilimonas pumila]|uniref:LysR family transcriptional regulator n=1 Tax=Motilimonas pumila TaxID=2303987 RepID=A0A418YD36_9GAMM|nr:LysR family transcriptional regulator [Motilimonas pumila]RJG42447.1 LysR family transcriptional regulator [Motilimonas pumila]
MITTKNMTNLYWFCLSVECGGFSAASIKANTSAPTVSRSVANLEQQLNEKLLHRDSKNFQLTNAGEEIYNKFSELFRGLEEQWQGLSNAQGELTGNIHISCPEPFADFFLQALALEFMDIHPNVNIHVHFSSDAETFISEKMDLAIVTMPATASHLIQRQLFETELALAASPTYLARRGSPKSVKALLEHNVLAGNNFPYWQLYEEGESIKIPVKPKYSINSLRLNIQAAISGAGICLMPKVALQRLSEQNQLVAVLPNVECPKGTAYMVWTDRKMIASRVVAFRDLVFERMSHNAESLWRTMFG